MCDMEYVHWLHANLLVLAADGKTPIRLGFSSKASHSTSQAIARPSPVLLVGDGSDAHAVFLAPAPARGMGAAAAMKANTAHDRIALCGPSSVCVCDLTPGMDALRRDGYARCTNIAPTRLAHSRVIDAVWHPLSDRHIVLLLAAARGGQLSVVIFDVTSSGNDEPDVDVALPTHAFTGRRPLALVCGEPRGWELLTLFILCDDASLFHVCPVLPRQALLPAADWEELLTSADAVTLAWLQTCFEALDAGDAGSAWRRYTGASTHAYFASGSRSRHVPCLNGPITTTPSIAGMTGSEGGTNEPACAAVPLSAAATEFTTLAILTTHGRVVFIGSMDPIMPSWGRPTVREGGDELPLASAAAAEVTAPLVRASTRGGRMFATPGRAARATQADPIIVTGSPAGALDASAVPWIVLDAIDLDLDGAVALARESIASGGAAYAGGLPGDGLAEDADDDADRRGEPDTSDVIAVPLLMCDPARSDTLYVASRRTVHAVRCDWLPRSRAVLAGRDVADEAPPTLVKSLHDAEHEDVAGVTTCTQDGGDALRVWILPANASVLMTLPQGASTQSSSGTQYRPSLLRPPPTSRGAPTSAAASMPRAPALVGRLHSFSAVSTAAATAPATAVADVERDGGLPQSALLQLEPFQQIISDARADLEAVATSALAADMKTADAPIDSLARGVEALTKRAATLGDLRAHMHARARVLVDAAASARARADALSKDVTRVHAAHVRAQERMHLCDARAEDLRARAQAILLALSLRQRVWSAAEAQYSEEVSDVAAELRSRVPAQLQKLSDLIAAITATTAASAAPALAELDMRNVPGFAELQMTVDELRSTMHSNEVVLAEVSTSLASAL